MLNDGLLKDSPPGQEGWIQTERSECLETGWWPEFLRFAQDVRVPVCRYSTTPPRQIRFAQDDWHFDKN